MDRRTFVGAIGAAFLTKNLGFTEDVRALYGKVAGTPNGESGDGPCLVPIPVSIAGVREPVVNLAGDWKFTVTPPVEFWTQKVDASGWSTVSVPNEFAMLGFEVTPNREYPCRRRILIPPDFGNQRIFLRFDGAYGYARVWVNGAYLREHYGGFTSWDCEITDHVKAGDLADLAVGITDRSDDISQASYYAKHSIAGIIRDVRLFAVPRNYLNSLVTSVTLDKQYENGLIHLSASLFSQSYGSAKLNITLTDKDGKRVPMEGDAILLSPDKATATHEIVVRTPKRWDAEHPDLYDFEASVVLDGQVTETVRRRIGFRSVECSGNQLLVNGQPVKLRGACRHSIHPIYGRAVPAIFDEKDAGLFRAANINFVRTSHYPPTEQFLEACDRHGIYVEEETAVCWSTVDGGPSSDPEFTGRFISQFEEMIARDHAHPSVLFWSLGNESHWGENFAVERRYATKHDPSRPAIFSYPDTVPLATPAFDIYSKHYANVESDLRSDTYPLLNDEFAHIPCYNLDTLRRDPGVRNFWGESIRRFGEKFLASSGCLGGSIWAGIDEIFLLPKGPVGYGPWGVIDGWRRPKPEYWLTQKAYSPIRIEDRSVSAPKPGSALILPIMNAFDHTNLKDVAIRWSAGADSGALQAADIAPHRSGYLEIPQRDWRSGDTLDLEFHSGDRLIDRFRIPVGPSTRWVPKVYPATASLHDEGDIFRVAGNNFAVTVSKMTGLVKEAKYDRQVVLLGGPFIDFGQGPLSSHWLLRRCEASTKGDTVVIMTAGEFKQGEGIESIPVEFEIEIDGSALVTTRYRIQAKPTDSPHLGVAYILPANFDRLAWHRKSQWSWYPDDHIGRPKGVAFKQSHHAKAEYREEPTWPWAEDMNDFFLFGKGDRLPQATNDFRSLKPNIWYAACSQAGSTIRVRAEADADAAVRASVLPDSTISFTVYNFWSFPDLDWGNFTGPAMAPAVSGRETRLRLTDLAEE